jgi:hypothetical protein
VFKRRNAFCVQKTVNNLTLLIAALNCEYQYPLPEAAACDDDDNIPVYGDDVRGNNAFPHNQT